MCCILYIYIVHVYNQLIIMNWTLSTGCGAVMWHAFNTRTNTHPPSSMHHQLCTRRARVGRPRATQTNNKKTGTGPQISPKTHTIQHTMLPSAATKRTERKSYRYNARARSSRISRSRFVSAARVVVLCCFFFLSAALARAQR